MPSKWWPVLEIAGWASGGLLLLIALIVIISLAIRKRQRSLETQAARALLGATSMRSQGPTPSTSVPGSCISSMSGGDLSGLDGTQARHVYSLARSPKVPCVARLLYPALTLCCCGLFVWADMSETAEVHVKLLLHGAPHGDWEWSGVMASLTLVRAAEEAWESNSRLTAIVLGFLNGVWPFLQTGVLLIVWFLPGSCISHSTRGSFLRLFAAFGKCGLSFPWLVSIWAAVCQLQWRGQQVFADFSMSLEKGLFLFLGAAIVTNILGYAADHFHGVSTKVALPTPWPRSDRCVGGSSSSLSAYSQNRYWPALLCPLVAVTTVGSSVITAFSVSLAGSGPPALTSIVDNVRPQFVRSYSLLSFGLQFPEISEAEACSRLLQGIFLATSLLVPLVLAGVLLIVWILPLQPKTQNLLLKLAYALDACVALDVFVAVVAVAAVDFGKITTYATNHGSMLEACTWMERELSRQACVGANVQLERGFGLLAASGLALLIVPKVVLRACTKAAEHRDQSSGRARASSALVAASVSDPVPHRRP
mmetsp:Transcript_33157/g.76599  ORF Transcript_33157/g.76599 Transcript_33157/m.76599 type:complete len:536 (+) Transcript_33157:121-1728(+)